MQVGRDHGHGKPQDDEQYEEEGESAVGPAGTVVVGTRIHGNSAEEKNNPAKRTVKWSME